MPTHRERLEKCISGERPDRPPVALWRHFPVDDQDPVRLARATLAFQNTFDFDLVKVTPASSFCLKDWGISDVWLGDTEGTRDYTQPVIQHPDDWEKLPALDPDSGHLGAQLECLRILHGELEPDTPIIQTIFSPLSQAKNLIGKANLVAHLRQHPDALNAGLKTIAEVTLRFIQACTQIGISGFFYAVQHAQYGLLTEQEYRIFGAAYDLPLLDVAQGTWLNILHLHGTEVMFSLLKDYPVQVINWHDQETAPTLSEAQEQLPGVVCGGLKREETMVLGTPEQVQAEAIQAIEMTGGNRFILGTGCVTPITAPYGNLVAARQAVES